MQKILKNEIGSIDVFLILFSGMSTRFDQSTIELLLWYEAIFGRDMWKHVVTETTFWSHDIKSVNKRLKERDGLDERKRQLLWAQKFHAPPLNVPRSLRIPTMFIDPVVDVFVDPCDPSYREPEKREKEMFIDWTNRFQQTIDSIPPFDCKNRCQAPDAFFSGAPWLIHPRNQTLFLQLEEAGFLEWQIWNGLGEEASDSFQILFNGAVTYQKRNRTEGLNLLTGNIRLTEESLSGKITSIRLDIRMTDSLEGSFVLENGRDTDRNVGRVLRVQNAEFSEWSEWSPCNVPCLNETQTYGKRSRVRTCSPGRNGGRSCSDLTDVDGLPTIDDRFCAGDAEVPVICPIQPMWTEWTEWSDCRANCGPSQRKRSRSCADGRYGGAVCSSRIEFDTEECFEKPCPVDCRLGDWSAWSTCSASCMDFSNVTFPSRSRRKEVLERGNSHGLSCRDLKSEEVVPCNMKPCPVDGAFGAWSDLGPCSVRCGTGTKLRQRICSGPLYGGKPCSGNTTEQVECVEQPCEEGACEYSEWSSWGECSEPCGKEGQRKRRRTVERGTECEEVLETETCFNKMCGEDEFVLDSITVALSDMSYAGSDNSWKIKMYIKEHEVCETEWLDRHGVNDWESNSETTWRHRMNLPSDAFFGSCLGLKLHRWEIPSTLTVELLGYRHSDNIHVREIIVAFQSPAWVGLPLEFKSQDPGWSETNQESFHLGGVHLKSRANLLNPGRYCCSTLEVSLPFSHPHSRLRGTYEKVALTQDNTRVVYKHKTEIAELYFWGRPSSQTVGWTLGRTHRSRTIRNNFFFNIDASPFCAVNAPDTNWRVRVGGSLQDFENLSIQCLE